MTRRLAHSSRLPSSILRTMIQLHDSMMDQMRASLDASMNELMNRDPMWQMMRSSTYLDALESHEQDIDRMLARGG